MFLWSAQTNPDLIALDADSVMVDYNAAFPYAWEKAFGYRPEMVDPDCYHANNMYGMDLSDPAVKAAFYSVFDEQFWSALPALPGVVEACAILKDKGYRLVCVTSMPLKYRESRVINLRNLGLQMDAVFACQRVADEANPKQQMIEALMPAYFADDLLSNFIGLPEAVKRIWVNRPYKDDPNVKHPDVPYHEKRASLLEFAQNVRPVR